MCMWIGLQVSQDGSYTKNCASCEGVVSDTYGKLARYMDLPETRIAMKKTSVKWVQPQAQRMDQRTEHEEDQGKASRKTFSCKSRVRKRS